jgi:hypothetical protein
MVNPDRQAADGHRAKLSGVYVLPASEGVLVWAEEMRKKFG